MIFVLLFGITSYAEEPPKELYAQSAVLMDADSGRILFEKNGFEQKAMASTTKIMTCILTLETANVDDVVTISKNAAKQPRVHLGMREGERFYLRDLLYSLMLESHNDSAVAIAEHVGGSVEGFAELMNAKAKSLGCEQTYFITPNGLDAVDQTGTHSTTAADLATIMSYCIGKSEQQDLFLKITQTPSHSFKNVDNSRSFSCNNHNAFLNMMEGAISGKTGFTGDAGYCYVGALRRGERTFVVALLACGWPNNKGYKWSDTKKLMEYAIDNYQYRDVYQVQDFPDMEVQDGVPLDENLFGVATTGMQVDLAGEEEKLSILLKNEENVAVQVDIKEKLQAPVIKGEEVGRVTYYLGDEIIKQYSVVTTQTIGKKNIAWYFNQVWKMYALE